MEVATFNEQQIAKKIIEAMIAEGYSVRIHDGEGWACKSTKDASVAMAAIMSADEDMIHARKAVDGKMQTVGTVTLIYGNGNNGADVVSDCTENMRGYTC